MNVTQVAKELRAEGLPAKVAVRLAKALVFEGQGDMIKAQEYLAAAIAEEEKLNS